VSTKQYIRGGFRFTVLLFAIIVRYFYERFPCRLSFVTGVQMLRHFDVCRIVSFQCLSLAVLSSQSLVVNDSLPQLFGMALACAGLVALFSGTSTPRPLIVKHPKRCAWLPAVCAVTLSNTCYEAVDENPDVSPSWTVAVGCYVASKCCLTVLVSVESADVAAQPC
jgi:hypothetical protein